MSLGSNAPVFFFFLRLAVQRQSLSTPLRLFHKQDLLIKVAHITMSIFFCSSVQRKLVSQVEQTLRKRMNNAMSQYHGKILLRHSIIFMSCVLITRARTRNLRVAGQCYQLVKNYHKLHTLRMALHILYKQSYQCRKLDQSWKKEFMKGREEV